MVQVTPICCRPAPYASAPPPPLLFSPHPLSQVVSHDFKHPGSSQVFRSESDTRSGCGTWSTFALSPSSVGLATGHLWWKLQTGPAGVPFPADASRSVGVDPGVKSAMPSLHGCRCARRRAGPSSGRPGVEVGGRSACYDSLAMMSKTLTSWVISNTLRTLPSRFDICK